jgi:arylsulfatase A-like enzyme/cytochrome c-type biogenesis protein CcmH/NrfG
MMGTLKTSRRNQTYSSRRPVRGGTAVAFSVILLLFGFLIPGCVSKTNESIPPVPSSPPFSWRDGIVPGRWNLLVITMDTTRRDALGLYGASGNPTPTLDSLGRAGTVFEDVVTSVPMTLPSHTTLFSGMDPPEHGVRHNGVFTVPDSLVLLAELFQEHGYTTAAFVSGFPLLGRFGLDQGFTRYDDQLRKSESGSEESSEREARRTTDAVVDWMGNGLRSPYFLWVHYFDPHFPYLPPEPFRTRFASQLYEGEVSYMDSEIGRLLSSLRARGALDSTFVLAVGDHGEGLGEHKEAAHSFFIYDTTLRVPCILAPPARWTGIPLSARKLAHQVRMRDWAPTLANLLGWPADHWKEIAATSRVNEMEGGPDSDPVAYIETLAPSLDYGWHDLRGVRTQAWKYIRAPREELYHLTSDPAETSNVITKYPKQTKALQAWLDWELRGETREVQPQAIDPQTRERLRSLGYLGGSAQPGKEQEDPKDKIQCFADIEAARWLGSVYRYDEAIRLLKPIVREEPQIISARRMLGLFAVETGDLATARQALEKLVREEPDDDVCQADYAHLLQAEGKPEEALKTLELIEARNPGMYRLFLRKGSLLEALGRPDEAVHAYERSAARNPGSAVPYREIADLRLAQRDTLSAQKALRTGLRIDPSDAACLSALGEIAFMQRRTSEGDSLVSRALQMDPDDYRANSLRGWQEHRLGKFKEAEACYLRSIRSDPRHLAARIGLGTLYLQTDRPALAQKCFEEALKRGSETASLHLNLGIALAQQNQMDAAVRQWNRGLELPCDPATRARLTQVLSQARSHGAQ